MAPLMQPVDIASVLDEIGRASSPTARRLDAGESLAGPVAVLPSAFNPPTLAHLELLSLAAASAGGAAAALLSTRNVDKGLYGAPLEHRAGMLLALGEEPGAPAVFAVNAARIADQGAALRAAFPEASFDFVVGFDTLLRLFEPRYYDASMIPTLDAFFTHHRVIAANREGTTVGGVEAFIDESPTARRYRSRIMVRELGAGHAVLSSTAAREDAAAGLTPRAVPRPVVAYIERYGLYRA